MTSWYQKHQFWNRKLLFILTLPKKCGGVQLFITQKPINKPYWQKGKFALFQMPETGERRVVDVCPVDDSPFPSPPTLATSGDRAFIHRRRGYMQKQHGQLWQSSSIWSSVWFNIILIVLGTVNLQLQRPFIPISLRPILGIVEAHVLVSVWFCS